GSALGFRRFAALEGAEMHLAASRASKWALRRYNAPMAGRREDTALGVARSRFIEGLPRRTRELKGAIALLVGAPDDVRAREELRRRLHALVASAQVFRIEVLADGLKACIELIDGARAEQRGLSEDELNEITRVTKSLPELAEAAAPRG